MEFCVPDSSESAAATLARAATKLGFRVELDDTGRGCIRHGKEWRALVFGAFAQFVEVGVRILPLHGSTVIQLSRRDDGWIGITGSVRHERTVRRLVDSLAAEFAAPCFG